MKSGKRGLRMPKKILEHNFLAYHQKRKNPLGFICYDEILKAPAEQVKMFKFQFALPEGNRLSKLDCMLLYPADAAEALKDHILVLKSVKQLGLTAIVKRSERPEVFTPEIGNAISENKPAQVEICMRPGHTIHSTIRGQSRYALAVLLGKTQVLIFKHGILEIKVLGKGPKPDPIRIRAKRVPPKAKKSKSTKETPAAAHPLGT